MNDGGQIGRAMAADGAHLGTPVVIDHWWKAAQGGGVRRVLVADGGLW